MPSTIYTIGHSTRSWEDFLSILNAHHIKRLVDVRLLPGSNRYPHFNQEHFIAHLPSEIQYFHFRDLGGRRKPKPDSKNAAWRNASFRGYADYMEEDQFKEAIAKLEALAHEAPLAYMCSEAVWWKCHRGLISDHLKRKGWEVLHIVDATKLQAHPYTAVARQQQERLFGESTGK